MMLLTCSDKHQHSSTPIYGELGVYHIGRELQESLAAGAVGGTAGGETFTCLNFALVKVLLTSRPLHCCIPQSVEEEPKTLLHLLTKLCVGKYILFQDLSAKLLQEKTGTEKNKTKLYKELADKNRTKTF